MNRKERQKLILTIIQEKEISTQEELAKELAGRGLKVTQATISRDINSLELIKELGKNGSCYKLPIKYRSEMGSIRNSLESSIADTVTKIDRVEYMLVMHTLPGGAPKVAFHIDQEKIPGVLGTIAGDDTILIIIQTRELAMDLMAKWKKALR